MNYFIVYYLVSDIAWSEKDKKIILWTMVISAVGVTLASIGAAAGTVKYPGAFVGGWNKLNTPVPQHLSEVLLWKYGKELKENVLRLFIFLMEKGIHGLYSWPI